MRYRKKLQRRRQGFVLLLVVMLLAICCLIFTQIALKSQSKVNQFVTGQRELADYWAMTSMRRAVMPNANLIWIRSVEQRTEPNLRIDFTSGTYLLKLENESSKLNLVRAWRDFPVQAAQETIGSELMMFDGQAQKRFEELDGRVSSWRQLSTVLDQSILDRTNQITLWEAEGLTLRKPATKSSKRPGRDFTVHCLLPSSITPDKSGHLHLGVSYGINLDFEILNSS